MATKSKQEGEANKLAETMARMNKLYGTGTVITLGDKNKGDYEIISTGSIGVDYIVLGIGGVAIGKVYEIRGWEGTGKSTICANLMANCQKRGKGKVLCIDAEHAADIKYYKALGINTDELLFNQPGNGEEGFSIAENMIKTGEIDLCIIDSDSGLIPASIMNTDVSEVTKVGKKGNLNSTAYPKIKVAANENDCAVVIISQYREKIGQMWGDPKTTQGGHCLKFTADVICEMSKSMIKTEKGEEVPGNKTKFKTIKNKLFPPYREWEFDILFGEGVDTFKETLEMAEELKILGKSGSWYTWKDTNIANGWDKLVVLMKDNDELYQEIKSKLVEALKQQ